MFKTISLLLYLMLVQITKQWYTHNTLFSNSLYSYFLLIPIFRWLFSQTILKHSQQIQWKYKWMLPVTFLSTPSKQFCFLFYFITFQRKLHFIIIHLFKVKILKLCAHTLNNFFISILIHFEYSNLSNRYTFFAIYAITTKPIINNTCNVITT